MNVISTFQTKSPGGTPKKLDRGVRPASQNPYPKNENTKLNARLALRQRADLLAANISTNRISLPQGQSLPYPIYDQNLRFSLPYL